MRLSIDHQTGFSYATPVASSYNEARMTPASSDHQTVWTSRISIDPVPWSFTYTDYWGTSVTTFEVHEPHERLTVHAQTVAETRGDDLPWDSERRVAASDLGWPALTDRGVIDSMTEYLTVGPRTAPPAELRALAAEQAPAATPAGGAGRLSDHRRPPDVREGLDLGDQHRRTGLGGRARRVP